MKYSALKKASRVLGLIIKTTEKCFDKAIIDEFEISRNGDYYILNINIEYGEFSEISASSENKCIDRALEDFIIKLNKNLAVKIRDLEKEEKIYISDLNRYGRNVDDESPTVCLTSLRMFSSVIKSIKI